jgi:hypothetical protein
MVKKIKRSEKQRIAAALQRLQTLLRSAPDIAPKLHLHLNRTKGIRLLSDLFDSDEFLRSSGKIQ